MDQKIDKLFIKRLLIIALSLALAVIYIKQILGLTVTVWGASVPAVPRLYHCLYP